MKHMKREFSQLSNGAIEVHRVLAADLLENGIGSPWNTSASPDRKGLHLDCPHRGRV